MKRITKFIAIATLSLALLCCGVTVVGAESAQDGVAESANTAISESAEDVSGVTEDIGEVDGAPNDDAAEADTVTDGNDDNEKSVFAALYEALESKSAEIASITAAVCSVILAFVMSKGLTPTLKNALGSMTRAANKLGDGVSESEKRSAEITGALTERLALSEATIEKLTQTVSALSESCARADEEQMMREDILTVMSAQVELLYDVFMSSSLPKYKKDAVGERVAVMRSKLIDSGAGKNEA